MARNPAIYSAVSITLFLLPSFVHAADARKPEKTALSSATAPTEQLGAVAGWSAYTYREKSGRVCYVIGEPQKSEPVAAKRKHPAAMVTHRPGEKVENVVSFVEGYPLKSGSDASLDIGGAKFDLFTNGDTAWARTSELDKAIVDAMAKAKQAVVKGTPQRGPGTSDVYSLTGFAQALSLIDKACEVKR